MALSVRHLQESATSTADGNTIPVGGKAGVLLEVSGISGDTITVEGKLQNSWSAIDCYDLSGGTRSTTISADGKYWAPTPGVRSLRARISSYGSGTINVVAGATDVPYGNTPT